MEQNNSDVRLALEEMRINMQQSLDAGDSLDQKLGQILVASGSVLALVSVLNLALSPSQSDLYWLIFLIVVVLYMIAIFLALVASRPQRYQLPISPEWEELEDRIFNKAERDVYLTLLSGYVEQIQNNRKINGRKAKLYKFSLLILPGTLILLIALLFIQ